MNQLISISNHVVRPAPVLTVTDSKEVEKLTTEYIFMKHSLLLPIDVKLEEIKVNIHVISAKQDETFFIYFFDRNGHQYKVRYQVELGQKTYKFPEEDSYDLYNKNDKVFYVYQIGFVSVGSDVSIALTVDQVPNANFIKT